MSNYTVVGTAYVDNGPGVSAQLQVEQETHIEWSRGPRADPAWTFTDTSGHFHAYGDVERDRYPTLLAKTEAVPCDGSCGGVCEGEGYTITRYICRICAEQIEPGLIQGPHSFAIPGLKRWTVGVSAFVAGPEVSIRFERDNGDAWFGVAVPVQQTISSDWQWTELAGSSPLGQLKKVAAPV